MYAVCELWLGRISAPERDFCGPAGSAGMRIVTAGHADIVFYSWLGPASRAAAFHGLTWANWGWRPSRARLWYQRARAWWRRRQRDHRAACHRDRGRVVAALNRRLISATVSGIMPGSAGGRSWGLAGGGAWVSVRGRAWA